MAGLGQDQDGRDVRRRPALGPARLVDPAELAGSLVAVAVAIWLTRHLWGPGMLPGDDTMAHVLRAEFTVRELLPAGKLDGWQADVGLGYQQFLFYGPGFTWLVALAHWLSVGSVSVPGAVTLVSVGSFVLVPLAVAFLARSFGLEPWAAGLAAILSLCVSSPFGGVGLPGTFGVGLLPHQLGAVLTLVALGGILRLVADPGLGWALLVGASLAGVFLTHAISIILLGPLLGVILVTFLVTDRPTARTFAYGALALALTVGLAAFWLVPSLAHRDLLGVLTSWENPPLHERLADILSGRLLFRGSVMVWFLLAGWLYLVHRFYQHRRWALGLLVAPFAYLWIADLFLRTDPQGVVSLQLANRGLGYVGVIAVLPLAALLGHVARRYGRPGAVAAIACAVLLVVPATNPENHVARTVTPTPPLRALADELREHVPPGARFAVQRDFPIERQLSGVPSAHLWLAWASGRRTLNVFHVESSATPGPDYEPDRMTRQPPDVTADNLTRFGVTHVAVVNDASARALLASPRFATVWRSPPMALLAIVPRSGRPAPGSLLATAGPAEARLVQPGPERVVIEASAAGPTTATVAIGWSPKWRASVNGRPVPLTRSPEGLLSLPLPAGASTVTLGFGPDRWDQLGLLLTLLTLVGLLAWAWRRRTGAGAGTAEREPPAEAPEEPEEPAAALTPASADRSAPEER